MPWRRRDDGTPDGSGGPTPPNTRIGSLSSSEILRQQRCHEAWEHQFALYRILPRVLVPSRPSSPVIASKHHAARYSAVRYPGRGFCCGIGERSRSTQVASRIGSFRLEGDGRRLVGADLDIAPSIPLSGASTNRILVYFYCLQACEIIIRTLQGRGAVGTSLFPWQWHSGAPDGAGGCGRCRC